METHASRHESPPVDSQAQNLDVPLRPDCPYTLTDELNRAEMLALRGRIASEAKRVRVVKLRRSPFGISPYELAPRLKPVDRICQRWAVSIGDGLPNWAWDMPTKSRPPPLDDDTAIVVDQIIMKRCAPASRRLLVKWYRSDAPVSAIADQMISEWHSRKKRSRLTNWRGRIVDELKESLQMTENGVILCWNLTLDELRNRFEESKHPALHTAMMIEY